MATRRDFIRNSTVAIAIAGLDPLRVLADPSSRVRSGRISVSESFLSPQWLAAFEPVAAGGGNSADRAFLAALKAQQSGINDLFAATAPDIVNLVSLPAPGVEPFALRQARSLAIEANETLAEALSSAGSSARGLATLSAFDPKAVKEAERAIGTLKMAGLSLGANRGMTLDHPSLHPVYEFAAAAGVPVYLPAAYSPSVGDVPYRAIGNAGVIFGASADSSKHATQLIFGGVLDAHPKLRVILARMGEGTPYWYSLIRDTYESLRQSGSDAPLRAAEEYFNDNILLTTADMSSRSMQFCAEMLGDGRVVSSHDHMRPAFTAPSSELEKLATTSVLLGA